MRTADTIKPNDLVVFVDRPNVFGIVRDFAPHPLSVLSVPRLFVLSGNDYIPFSNDIFVKAPNGVTWLDLQESFPRISYETLQSYDRRLMRLMASTNKQKEVKS